MYLRKKLLWVSKTSNTTCVIGLGGRDVCYVILESLLSQYSSNIQYFVKHTKNV